jgi:VWFA-related protein
MNIKTLSLFLVVFVLCISVFISSCKKSSTGPDTTPVVTQVNANGSLASVSRTQVAGIMSVTDQNGNPITGLTSQNVIAQLKWLVASTYDSVAGTPTIQSLSQSGKKIAVALTMDYSGSMFSGVYDSSKQKYKRIVDMESATKAFINAMKTGDVAEIIKFGDAAEVVQAFTGDKSALLHIVDTLSDSRGMTALYESINQGLVDAALQSTTTYARAIVAFTDGGENNSTVTRLQMLQKSWQYAIPVYTIGLLDSSAHSTPPGQNSSQELDLVQIADTTGGFYFYAPNASQLTQIYAKISGQISNAYAVSITWPSTGLPPTGTNVNAIITVIYNNLKSQFSRTYTIQ